MISNKKSLDEVKRLVPQEVNGNKISDIHFVKRRMKTNTFLNCSEYEIFVKRSKNHEILNIDNII